MKEITIAILKIFFTKGVTGIWDNKKNLSLYFKTLFWTYRNKDIRFSISYLFRIKIPNTDSYLLVFNRRIENQLQPVGGVYKRYGDDKLFEKWDYHPDHNGNGLGTDEISTGDLRFKVKGKNVIDVIKWFEEGKEREVSSEREFNEELIETKILDKDTFQKIKYKHIKRVSKNLKWSEHHTCFEVLIYDIMELLPTREQADALVKLSANKFNKEMGYAVVDFNDISQLRFVDKGKQLARIGEHTKLTINQN